jgi:hypothetical protein
MIWEATGSWGMVASPHYTGMAKMVAPKNGFKSSYFWLKLIFTSKPSKSSKRNES